MMLTEEQARTKLCPHIRVCLNTIAVLEHRHEPIYDHACCIASECNAWRWGMKNGEPAYERTAVSPGHFDNAPMGYCGLAGRPED